MGHHKKYQAHLHQYDNKQAQINRSFFIATGANGLYVVLQIVASYLTHSTSLLADACHNLGDVLSLALAWGAFYLMKKKPTDKATYGLKKTSILAALINGGLLVFTCGIIVTKAIYQFFSPSPIHAFFVMLIASMGILINGFTALLFMRDTKDLNIRGAYLHLLSDAAVSVGVVFSAALLYLTGWLWIDPLVGILIAGVILKGTWSLCLDSLRLMIDAVPKDISSPLVRAFFLEKPGVCGVHDLHIWAMSSYENALSVHLYMPQHELKDDVRAKWVSILNQQFNIQHVTIQVENTKTCCIDACSLDL